MLCWLSRLFRSHRPALTDLDRARALLQAVDRGGVPLDPVLVNGLARRLGMDVSRRAPMTDTLGRLRVWVAREDETAVASRATAEPSRYSERR